MTRAVLSPEAVRRLAKKEIRVQASSKVGFQLIKYPGGHVDEVPERMEGAAMIEYIGFQPATAQKLWRTYADAQKQTKGGLDLYGHAKNYLTRKFEDQHQQHKHQQHQCRPKDRLASAGLATDLVHSLISLVRRISTSQQFKLNRISSHNLRDWAIMKIKKRYYRMKFLDAHVLNPSSPSLSKVNLGMFPLSRLNVVVPAPVPSPGAGAGAGAGAGRQIVAITSSSGKPVADGFYVEKDGQVVPGWKGVHLNNNNNNNAIMPVGVGDLWLVQVLPVQVRKN